MSEYIEKLGVYSYAVTNYDGTFTTRQVDVKVIGETAKSYQIQLLGFTLRRGPRETLWVSKSKVKIKSTEYKNVETSEPKHWWNDK